MQLFYQDKSMTERNSKGKRRRSRSSSSKTSESSGSETGSDSTSKSSSETSSRSSDSSRSSSGSSGSSTSSRSRSRNKRRSITPKRKESRRQVHSPIRSRGRHDARRRTRDRSVNRRRRSSSRSSGQNGDLRRRRRHDSGRDAERTTRRDEKKKDVVEKEYPKKQESPKPTNLRVGNLTKNVTKCVGRMPVGINIDHVFEIFSVYGPLKSVDMPLGKFNINRGFAFVQYESGEDAEKAQKHMDGGQIDGNDVSVVPAVAKPVIRPSPPRYGGSRATGRLRGTGNWRRSPVRYGGMRRSRSRSAGRRSPRRYRRS
ncbi:RNA-binding protein with serine-rich domain 1 [Trichinella pseudospiralis]|uniref:RNA-binding protein with serine-rich domain 1 n=1 Tax=Trichinella pseudospiralis TaxID=6337 RepID=A0A0V1K2R0_TRIPS|nr:RNA-binding protein with serine-rich domain 1 [Trichinella pseudospiralis]KRZ26985.1 RNA-binding protein with serine-rich domain 1 [Trichinella pseudospiralis]KRZ41514.1 RNA-binding protein with serine-rich domain 1 [Trichinella pseudospiralis]